MCGWLSFNDLQNGIGERISWHDRPLLHKGPDNHASLWKRFCALHLSWESKGLFSEWISENAGDFKRLQTLSDQQWGGLPGRACGSISWMPRIREIIIWGLLFCVCVWVWDHTHKFFRKESRENRAHPEVLNSIMKWEPSQWEVAAEALTMKLPPSDLCGRRSTQLLCHRGEQEGTPVGRRIWTEQTGPTVKRK